MRFKIGKYLIKINRSSSEKKKNNVSADDFVHVGQDTLKYIQQLSKDDIDLRLKSISVSDLISEENIHKAKKLLRTEGIFIVPNFIDKVLANEIYQANLAFESELKELLNRHKTFFENDAFLVQVEETKVLGYKAMADYHKPVVDVRQGVDSGMIDVFNFDKLKEMKNIDLTKIVNHQALLEILGDSGHALKLSNINAYMNNGVTSTRGFHIDDLSNTIKSFIYLVDVESLDQGPYCYVKGTQNNGAYRRMNIEISEQFINKTEAPFLPYESIVPVLGKMGCLVVSDQSGIHRGIPQSETGKRALLVARYK